MERLKVIILWLMATVARWETTFYCFQWQISWISWMFRLWWWKILLRPIFYISNNWQTQFKRPQDVFITIKAAIFGFLDLIGMNIFMEDEPKLYILFESYFFDEKNLYSKFVEWFLINIVTDGSTWRICLEMFNICATLSKSFSHMNANSSE